VNQGKVISAIARNDQSVFALLYCHQKCIHFHTSCRNMVRRYGQEIGNYYPDPDPDPVPLRGWSSMRLLCWSRRHSLLARST